MRLLLFNIGMMNDKMYVFVGKRIKQNRIQLKMTQECLAEKSGISPSFLGHIELGTRKASLDTFVKICNALNVTPNDILIDSIDCKKDEVETDILKRIYEFIGEYIH